MEDEPGAVDLGIPGVGPAVESARGGFATVYRAEQPAFRRAVAVKVLDRRLDAASSARFERERQAMGVLGDHPAILSVFDGGTTSDGRPYLLMPFCARGSLQDALDRGERRSWQETVELGVRLAGALAAAHREGVLHRDVKPANVLLSRYGEALLSDFGIARIVGGPETTTGSVTASIAHAAPEILDGRRPSERSDVYSLASTMYAILTGAPPFTSVTDESVVPVIARIMTAPLPDLPAGTPPDLGGILRRAMAKRPEDRYEGAADFGSALQAVQAAAGVPVTPMPLELGPGVARADALQPLVDAPDAPDVPDATVAVDPRWAGAPGASAPMGGLGDTEPRGRTGDDARTASSRRVAVLVGAAVLAVAGVVAVVLLWPRGTGTADGPPVDALARQSLGDGVVIDDDIRTLPFGSVRGTLDAGQALAYRTDPPAGHWVRVRMVSLTPGFDPLVAVFDGDGHEITSDDDSGGGDEGKDAVLEGFLTGPAPFTVVATSYEGETGGEFELVVDVPDAVELQEGHAGGALVPDGLPVAVYTFDGTAGEVVGVSTSSDEFHPVLAVLDPDGVVVGSDEDADDGEAGFELELPVAGRYAVVVKAPDGGTGSFALDLARL